MEDENKLIDEIKRDFPEINVEMKTKEIKYIKVKENDIKDKCLICFDDAKTKINCNHYFHEECITKWFKKSSSKLCPYCRKVIEFEITDITNEIDWIHISRQKLSEEFIKKFQDKVNWQYISLKQNLSEEFIREFQDKVSWFEISIDQKLSEEFIREFQDKDDWIILSQNIKNYLRIS